jgi:tartrate-resistant acid phosphatase type 5
MQAPAFDFGGAPDYIEPRTLTEQRGNFLKRTCVAVRLLECVLLVSPGATSLLYAQTSVRFAVLGDYGDTPPNTGNVATLVKSWNPDFVITTGDNNYTNPTPAPPNHYSAWDGAVGQYYHEFMEFPAGSGSAWAGYGSATIRFYPSVGNHDWDAGIAGWYSYFALPGNERYYDFVRGPVHFYAVDSDPREPDGNGATSTQAQWLQSALGASTSAWNFVYFHHPPYTSAARGNNVALQWPFMSWGAHAVLNGHEHQYERIMKGAFPYFVVGTGGRSLSAFATTEPGSAVRYSANYGALLVDAGTDSVVFRFYSISGGAGGTLIDRYVLYPSEIVPIQLANFTGTVTVGNRVRLDWSTITETNNLGFHVQKSTGGAGYAEILNSFVAGHGTTLEPHSYAFIDSAVAAGAWTYRLRQTDLNGTDSFTEGVTVELTTEVEGEPPRAIALFQNYPNPFNPRTAIRYSLSSSGPVRLAIYDPLGREIAILVNASQTAGTHTVEWDGNAFAGGIYYCMLRAGSFVQTRQLVLIK